jgi:ATP-dependent Clp protease ATP-binding subunit ClpA
MHERFSDRARHAMALANLEATQLNHNYLAPAHLMLGLIAEGACVAADALRVLHVDLDEVRAAVRAELGPGSGAEPSLGRRAQTKEMKDVMAAAIAEARRFEHRYVGTEHLLLALLHEPHGVAAQVLHRKGVNAETLRAQLLDLLRSSTDATHDLAHLRHGELEWVHQQELAKAFRSPSFWHTLILAVDSANRQGAGEIEPQHLLWALLRDERNGLAALLGEKGVTLDWLRERLPAGTERDA